MAAKKHKPDGESSRRPDKKPPAEPRKRPQRRGEDQSAKEDSALGKAQSIVYQALGEATAERQVALAREAIAVCPDCADAYLLLAKHAPRRKESLQLYEQALAAGERALGPAVFQRHAGAFWELLETRPYMRARQGLAHALWALGRHEEAVGHLREMLRLNPADNQRARTTLAGHYLFLGRDEDLGGLLVKYPDEGSAFGAYTRALLAFRQQGDTIEARRLLKAAKKTNQEVPEYFLGRKLPPPVIPESFTPGSENEALAYTASFLAGWKDTPGAIAWLRASMKVKKSKPAAPDQEEPDEQNKKWLRDRLPQEYDVWQADFRQMPRWIRDEGEMVRPSLILVTSLSADLVLGHEMPTETPTPAKLWQTLVQAMRHPAVGKSHRPTELRTLANEHWEALRGHLEDIGVELVVSEDLPELESMFAEMFTMVVGRSQPGLLEMPGAGPEQVGSFYEAAARFFRQAPWKKVGIETAIRVECDRYDSGPWYAVLMGQSGLTIGLSLYDDPAAIRAMWTKGAGERQGRELVGTSVLFGEEWEIPVADHDAATRYGWPVARSDAYPACFRKERGLTLRPPLGWELELMAGCLRAIPELVSRRHPDDLSRETFFVPATTEPGELKLVLSWMGEEDER